MITKKGKLKHNRGFYSSAEPSGLWIWQVRAICHSCLSVWSPADRPGSREQQVPSRNWKRRKNEEINRDVSSNTLILIQLKDLLFFLRYDLLVISIAFSSLMCLYFCSDIHLLLFMFSKSVLQVLFVLIFKIIYSRCIHRILTTYNQTL